MKPRTLTKTIQKAIKTFPAVVITGPRQAGKTTLLRSLFLKTHRFLSLENPDVRIRAKEDPLGFLEDNPPPLILDEIQYVPELLAYIKTKIDERRKPGQWLLTGSQNFALMQGVSQSLAGRAAVLSLLPFSLSERVGEGKKNLNADQLMKTMMKQHPSSKKISLTEVLLRGNYPEIASKQAVDRQLWCSSYLSTYLERDVRSIVSVGDLNQFERFLKLCAIRTGQLLNLAEMARDLGISVTTAKRWLSVLEASFQIFMLYPYFRNIGKRLVKSPKLYFLDTGLASFLMGIHEKETLLKSPHFGALFETLVITDFVKRFVHAGQPPSLSFIRTRDGLEIDLVLELGEKLFLFEIKSSATITPKHATSLIRLKQKLGSTIAGMGIISRSPDRFLLTKEVFHLPWQDILVK